MYHTFKQPIEEEITREIRKYFKLNNNIYLTYQNGWDVTKAVLRGKILALNIYMINEERIKVHYLDFHLKQLEGNE